VGRGRGADAFFCSTPNENGELGQLAVRDCAGGDVSRICGRESARQLLELDFPGYGGWGGWRSASRMRWTCEMAGEVTFLLPEDRPRYLMGVGRPEQIADYVALGDRHDGLACCRHARRGMRASIPARVGWLIKKRAATRRTSGRSIRNVRARFAGGIHERICGIFLRRERSPRRFWPPTHNVHF